MANLFDMKGGKMFAVLSKIAERLTPEVGDAILAGDTDVLDAIARAPMGLQRFSLVHGLFTQAAKQIVRIEQLRRERGWIIKDEQLAEAERTIPEWPEDRLVVVTLVPYLGTKDLDRVERTFQELWTVAASQQQQAKLHWDGYGKVGRDRLRLLEGIKHEVGLRWETIDLGCNRNKKPIDVRSPEKSPHAGILATAAMHPNWVKAMDGKNVPYVWIPGYEVNVSDGHLWQGVPDLRFAPSGREIGLGCGWCDRGGSDWAVPSFARPPILIT